MGKYCKATKFLFILNPIAGDIDKSHIPAKIKERCTSGQLEFKIFQTTGIDDEKEIGDQIETFGPEVVVVIGGDGTVHMVSRLLVGSGIILGIVPKGSGNGLAKDLHIPLDFDDAMEVVMKLYVRKIDTLLLNDLPFFHISDIGFNAVVVKRFSEKKIRGQSAYALALFQEFFKYKPKKYKIVTPDITYEGKALLVAIANANQFGSNTTINPLGEVDDGNFEISILKEFPPVMGVDVFYKLLENKIHQSKYHTLIKCHEAEIINYDQELIQVDGQIAPSFDRIFVKILPRSLRVIVPAKEKKEINLGA